MPDTDKGGDKESYDIIGYEGGAGGYKRDIPQAFRGEYLGLAEYIDFSRGQKRVVSCTITVALPVLLVGLFFFLLSFLITSFGSYSEATSSNTKRLYSDSNFMRGVIQINHPAASFKHKHEPTTP